jgi:hypothetical protein
MLWRNVWYMIRSYRPDWFDLGVVLPAIIGAIVVNSWYAGWTLKSFVIGALSAVFGFMAVSILYPLWFPDKR